MVTTVVVSRLYTYLQLLWRESGWRVLGHMHDSWTSTNAAQVRTDSQVGHMTVLFPLGFLGKRHEGPSLVNDTGASMPAQAITS